MTRRRVVVAGLGDVGVLTAIRLSGSAEVVGISAKPGLVSGQELGIRLTRPVDWARDYFVPFHRYRGLDRVRTVQARLTGVDLAAGKVYAEREDGSLVAEPFDSLVISTGVSNGFWRRPSMQSAAEVRAELGAVHDRLAAAGSVAVVGGGAAAVSAAANVAARWPAKLVDLYFPHDRPLRDYDERVWNHLRNRLIRLGIRLHPGYRAVVPDGFDGAAITGGEVCWSTGQPPAHADAVLWAIGRVQPNTEWLPGDVLDGNGFVSVTTELRVPGNRGVFAGGDVAATDPLRCSARNGADAILAHNVLAEPAGRPLKSFTPPRRRWGSVIGAQPDGLEVFAPNGRPFRIPAPAVDRVLMPLIVRRGIYRGIRANS